MDPIFYARVAIVVLEDPRSQLYLQMRRNNLGLILESDNDPLVDMLAALVVQYFFTAAGVRHPCTRSPHNGAEDMARNGCRRSA